MSVETRPSSGDGTEEFSTYTEYNKVLRAWFVAFGVGGPALFLINDEIGTRLAKTGQLRSVAMLFIIGTGSQILGAFVNKVSNWYTYRGLKLGDSDYRRKWRFKVSQWVVLQFWFDIGVDLVTIICFGFATWRLLTLFDGR
jgi:hypothetical protein